MNKKGVFQDGLVILTGFFLLAISIIVIYAATDITNTAFQEQELLTDNTKEHFDDFNTDFPSVFDWAFVTIFVGLVLAGMVLSYVVPANPLIFVFMLIVTIVVASLGGFISNAWDSSTTDGLMATSASSFPMMNFIMDNLLTLIVVIFILMLIAFYAKPEGGLN